MPRDGVIGMAREKRLSDFDSSDGHLKICFRGGPCDCIAELYAVARSMEDARSAPPEWTPAVWAAVDRGDFAGAAALRDKERSQ